MRCTIGPGNVRDISYILGNLRPGDAEEIACQLPEGASLPDQAATCGAGGLAWVAYLNGAPAMAFGASPMTAAGNVLAGWAFGTRKAKGCIREVVRFLAEVMYPIWIDHGVTRLEARSIATHGIAHRWMEATGAVCESNMPEWGRSGEAFKLYVWRDTPAMRAALARYCG